MGWVKVSERWPEKYGPYFVIKAPKGKSTDYLSSKVGEKEIDLFHFIHIRIFLSEHEGVLKYNKEKCFVDFDFNPNIPQEILYWYELDPIPSNFIINEKYE